MQRGITARSDESARESVTWTNVRLLFCCSEVVILHGNRWMGQWLNDFFVQLCVRLCRCAHEFKNHDTREIYPFFTSHSSGHFRCERHFPAFSARQWCAAGSHWTMGQSRRKPKARRNGKVSRFHWKQSHRDSCRMRRFVSFTVGICRACERVLYCASLRIIGHLRMLPTTPSIFHSNSNLPDWAIRESKRFDFKFQLTKVFVHVNAWLRLPRQRLGGYNIRNRLQKKKHMNRTVGCETICLDLYCRPLGKTRYDSVAYNGGHWILNWLDGIESTGFCDGQCDGMRQRFWDNKRAGLASAWKGYK